MPENKQEKENGSNDPSECITIHNCNCSFLNTPRVWKPRKGDLSTPLRFARDDTKLGFATLHCHFERSREISPPRAVSQ